jgi:hypothetical protein
LSPALQARALFALAAGLITWQLFVPPALGVADNGDYPKLIGGACIGGEHPVFDYVAFTYERAPANCYHSRMMTSAWLPFGITLAVTRPFTGNRYDLRFLGAAWAVLFLLAFAMLQRVARGRPWVPVAALLIFCGATYVPWFNSFYFDTASYVFLCLAVVAVIRLMTCETVRMADYVVAAVAVLLFALSKAQHAALALPLIAGFWLDFGRPGFPGRPVRIGVTAVIVFSALAMFVTSPRYYQTVNTWNALFYQALPHAASPSADLASIGIDTAMKRYVGKHAFLPDSPTNDPAQVAAFGRVITPSRLVGYYLRHPAIAVLVFRDALADGSLQRVRMQIGARQYRLGNYEKDTGEPPEAQSHFLDFWTSWKTVVFGNRPWLYAAWAVVLLAALWTLALRQPSKIRPRIVALSAMWTAMVVLAPFLVLFDGIDTGRHLFLFNAMLDMTVCGLIALIPARRG